MGCGILFGLLVAVSCFSAKAEMETVIIPGGKYKSFFNDNADDKKEGKSAKTVLPAARELEILSFQMDKYPVSIRQFNNFLKDNLKYRKSQIMPIFAEPRYLESWTSDILPEEELKIKGSKPATDVSWFVARKFCESQGKRLPSISEWEYASDASDPENLKLLLNWYAKTGAKEPENIGLGNPNHFGLFDMHGLIWEWVEDFNSIIISSDSRTKGDRTNGFFCGGGSINANNAIEYATFMRFGFRSGLKGNYCIKNLGFRCAKDIKKEN